MDTNQLVRHFFILLTIVAPSVSKQPKEKIIGPRFKPHEFKITDMTNAVKIEQVRAKILRALNMTLAPKIRELKHEPALTNATKILMPQPNRTTILSEAAASSRMDTMSFKLGSRISTPAEDIQSAILVVRLKAVQNPKKPKKVMSDIIDDKSVLAEKISSLAKNRKITEEMRKQLQKEEEINRSNERPQSDDLESSREQKGRNRMRQLDLPLAVKVVVRLVDETTGQRKRVTDTKVIVEKSTMMKVNLTKEVTEALRSPNHTLTIQVTCKRCKRRVQMENVFKVPKRKNRKSGNYARRLNPQRPFLVITTEGSSKSNFQNEIPQSRSKRHNSRDVCKLSYYEFLTGGENLSDCCGLSVFISFDQLGLGDVVLFPSGFSVVRCLECKQVGSADSPRLSPSNPGEQAVGLCEPLHKSPLELYYSFNETSAIIPKSIEDLTGGECNCSS